MVQFPLSAEQLLTPEECLEVDRTLLPSADKLAARLAVYALRYLKPIAQEANIAIADLQPEQITAWVQFDPQLQQGESSDRTFETWYIQLLLSAQQRLQQIAQEVGVAIEALSVAQVVAWFEQEVKTRLQSEQ